MAFLGPSGDLLGSLLSRIESEAAPKDEKGNALKPTISIRDAIAAVRELRSLIEGLPTIAKQLTDAGVAARQETGTGGRPGDDALLVEDESDPEEVTADLEIAFALLEPHLLPPRCRQAGQAPHDAGDAGLRAPPRAGARPV